MKNFDFVFVTNLSYLYHKDSIKMIKTIDFLMYMWYNKLRTLNLEVIVLSNSNLDDLMKKISEKLNIDKKVLEYMEVLL